MARGLKLAAGDGPGEDVRHESFALVEKLFLHHGVELRTPRRLHEHRANGARMGADVSADLLSQSQQIFAQRVGQDRPDLPGALDECGQHEAARRSHEALPPRSYIGTAPQHIALFAESP